MEGGPEYVKWLQRSLNRIMGAQLTCDGREVGPWRPMLAQLKTGWDIKEPGLSAEQIGKACYNEIIKYNDVDAEYGAWVSACLGRGGNVAGPIHTALKADLVKFQGLKDLTQDGWVGASTEAALVKATGKLPPGDCGPGRPPAPPPAPIPDWLAAWRKLGIHSRYRQWAIECADLVNQMPTYNDEIKGLATALSLLAQKRSDAYGLYFGSLWVREIATNPPNVLKTPYIGTAKDGWRFTCNEHVLKIYMMKMSSTQALNKIAHRPVQTALQYNQNKLDFIAHYKIIWDGVSAGMGEFNGVWGKFGDEGNARLYVVRGIMEALMRVKEHPYWAFRQLKSRKLDGPPGALKFDLVWGALDKLLPAGGT